MREARAVPVPVRVPVPLTTAADTGERIAFTPFTVRLLLIVSGWLTFESVRLKKMMGVLLLMLCELVPLKLTVLEFAVKAPWLKESKLKVKFPATLTVPVSPTKVPPAMVQFPVRLVMVLFALNAAISAFAQPPQELLPLFCTKLPIVKLLPGLFVQAPPNARKTSWPVRLVFVP